MEARSLRIDLCSFSILPLFESRLVRQLQQVTDPRFDDALPAKSKEFVKAHDNEDFVTLRLIEEVPHKPS